MASTLPVSLDDFFFFFKILKSEQQTLNRRSCPGAPVVRIKHQRIVYSAYNSMVLRKNLIHRNCCGFHLGIGFEGGETGKERGWDLFFCLDKRMR